MVRHPPGVSVFVWVLCLPCCGLPAYCLAAEVAMAKWYMENGYDGFYALKEGGKSADYYRRSMVDMPPEFDKLMERVLAARKISDELTDEAMKQWREARQREKVKCE